MKFNLRPRKKNGRGDPSEGEGFPREEAALTAAWRQYEEGKSYNRRIGYYRTVRENERFFRGDQWRGVDAGGLPTPVFNMVGRIGNYLVNSVMSYRSGISFIDDALSFSENGAGKTGMKNTERVRCALERLNRFTDYRFRKMQMARVLREAVTDALLSGDGVLYTYWDPTLKTGQPFRGDFRTVTVDGADLFVADVNTPDIQSQEYVLLSGRTTVSALRREAREAGLPEELLARITPDSETDDGSGDHSSVENGEVTAGKATFLVKFYRDGEGHVCFEKSVRGLMLRSVRTSMTRYPVACFNWMRTKGSYHGTSPLTELIPNQKYVNKAYAMVMKHMADTAFSKVIYDKKLIPEWTNEVGQAIGVVSGGDIRAAATTIGVGEMQTDFLTLIKQVISETKDLAGATEVALGEADPTNTSAIIALREAAEQPLDTVRENLYRCLEELANIWFEMMCEYYGEGRLFVGDGETVPGEIDFGLLRGEEIRAVVDAGSSKRYSQVTLLNTLDMLLKAGHINFRQYLERIPDGVLQDKDRLLEEVRRRERATPEGVRQSLPLPEGEKRLYGEALTAPGSGKEGENAG